jgi:hypothetical protein
LFSRRWSEPVDEIAGDGAAVNSSGGSILGSIPFPSQRARIEARIAPPLGPHGPDPRLSVCRGTHGPNAPFATPLARITWVGPAGG